MSTGHITDLDSRAADPHAGGSSWLAVSRGLDALMERLAADEFVDEGPCGDVTEAVVSAPFLAPRAAKLCQQRMEMMERARDLRRRVSVAAGNPDEVQEFAMELSDLAREEADYRVRARDLVWDSVTQDIGGER